MTVRFAQSLGDAAGSAVLAAANGNGGYHERLLHKRCATAQRMMMSVRYMTNVPVMKNKKLVYVNFPWLPPSEMLAAIMLQDPTRVTPPVDYWQRMLLDFPEHPARLLGHDVQATQHNIIIIKPSALTQYVEFKHAFTIAEQGSRTVPARGRGHCFWPRPLP